MSDCTGRAWVMKEKFGAFLLKIVRLIISLDLSLLLRFNHA